MSAPDSVARPRGGPHLLGPGLRGGGGLRVDAGGHYLQVGPTRVPVAVEDAPFVVVRVEPEAGGVVATLGDLSREPLDVETLRLGESAVPYCRVKGGRFAARLSRAATYQLLRMMEPDEATGQATLVLGGRRLVLPSAGGPHQPAAKGPPA